MQASRRGGPDPAQDLAARVHLLPQQRCRARVGQIEADQHPYRRRLACAVRTEQPAHLGPVLDREAEIGHSLDAAEVLGEVAASMTVSVVETDQVRGGDCDPRSLGATPPQQLPTFASWPWHDGPPGT